MFHRSARALSIGQVVLLVGCAFCLGYLVSDFDQPHLAATSRPQQAASAPFSKGKNVRQLLPLEGRSRQQQDHAPEETAGITVEITRRDAANPHSQPPRKSKAPIARQVNAVSNDEESRLFRVNVVLVLCGDRLNEVKTLIKSIVHFAKRSEIAFHLFADEDALPKMQDFFQTWQGAPLTWVTSTVQPLNFPADAAKTWKKLFRMCASQRLFIPDLLPEVDKAMYLDTDTLLVRDVADLWDFFDMFNSTHMAAMIKEGETPQTNWYKRHARHPFYGELGLNSGVMLMDLVKMRSVKMQQKLVALHEEYKSVIPWGDQDLLNIYFAEFPERMFPGIGCPWNYRTDHCTYSMNCKAITDSASKGIFLLHGNRRVFHNIAGAPDVRPVNVHPVFKAVYDLVEAAPLGAPFSVVQLDKYVAEAQKATMCKQAAEHIVLRMRDTAV